MKSYIRNLDDLEQWETIRPQLFERGSLTTMWFYFMCSFTLVPLLDSHETSRQLFIASCVKLWKYARYRPAAVIIHSGIKAVPHQLGVNLPQETLSCFSKIEKRLPMDSGVDIPITWAVPQHAYLLELLSHDGTGSEQSTVELGLVISEWNRLSLIGYSCHDL